MFNILKKHACIYIVFYNVIYITVGLSKREERKLRVRAKTLHGESYYLACLDAEGVFWNRDLKKVPGTF